MGRRGERKVDGHGIRAVFGANVRRLMADKGITAIQIADATGMSRRTVNRLVRGEVAVQLDTVGAVAHELRARPAELFLPVPAAADVPLLQGHEPRRSEIPASLSKRNRASADKVRSRS